MLKLKNKLKGLMPSIILRQIDITDYAIEQFAFSLSRELPPGSKILDAGAGEAPFKKFFKNHNYTAVDTKWGDSEWDYSKLDLVADLTKIPVKGESFDAVLCTQVLEHLKEPEKVLKELYRVLKIGGILYLSAPQGWGVHQAPYDYYRYTCYGLKYLLEKAGFKKIYIKPCCGYYSYLADRLTVFPKTMFWQIKSRWIRVILFPLELLSYFFFVFLFPVILNKIDFLDKKRDYTLNYFVKAVKSKDLGI